jgi:hypothetical protein
MMFWAVIGAVRWGKEVSGHDGKSGSLLLLWGGAPPYLARDEEFAWLWMPIR